MSAATSNKGRRIAAEATSAIADEVARRDVDIAQLTAFRVGSEEYVVDIMRVREILRPMPITRVRKGPRYLEGVINLRGSVIPIIDLRRRFDLPCEQSAHTKIIILSVDGRVVGLVVDSVTDVVRVPRSSIRPAPGLLEADRAPYFMGVVTYRGRTLILLNVKNVVGSDEPLEPPSADELSRPEPGGASRR